MEAEGKLRMVAVDPGAMSAYIGIDLPPLYSVIQTPKTWTDPDGKEHRSVIIYGPLSFIGMLYTEMKKSLMSMEEEWGASLTDRTTDHEGVRPNQQQTGDNGG